MLIDSVVHFTSGLAVLLGRLIQLQPLHTILVIYDDSSQNLVDQLPSCIPSHSEVAWIMVNQPESLAMWKNLTMFAHQTLMIIIAHSAYNQTELFSSKMNRRSKHIILLNENDHIKSKQMDNLLNRIVVKQINAIFLKNLIDRIDIYAWNPPEFKNGSNQLILLNEFEFFSSSQGNTIDSTYSGLFFNNVQSINGSQTEVITLNDPTNVYYVIDLDLKKSISGTEINIIDVIGEQIRSKLNYIAFKHSIFVLDIASEYFTEYVDKSYKTQVPVESMLDLKIANITEVFS